MTLEQNYRSTQAILSAANAVIGFREGAVHEGISGRSEHQASKPLVVAVRDEADQARYVVESVSSKTEKKTSS